MSTLTIQPSNIDTFLLQNDPTVPYGTENFIRVRCAISSFNHSILKFDFSALPDGADISAATLSLYTEYGPAVGRTYWVYELTQTGWIENEACWDHYKGTTHWATGGGDYTTNNGASQTVPQYPDWMNWDVIALVQHFQSAHSKVAHFLVMDGAEGTGNVYGNFNSREHAVDLSLRPKLVITYTAVQHYTLTAEAGSYTKTGQGAGLKVARKMAAAADSYSLAGQAAALRAARKMAAGAGSYSLAGQDAGLRAIRKMAAEGGSYVLTGQAANLKLAKKIPAGAGSYALTGQDAVLRAIRKMAAAGGSYVLTGMDANLALSKHYTLVCEAGYYGEPYSKIFVTLDGRIYKKMGDTYLRLA